MRKKNFYRRGAEAQSFSSFLFGYLATCLFAFCLLFSSCGNSNDRLQDGAVLPEYTGITPDRDTLTLSSFTADGKIVFVNFWAGWCSDCMKHNPEILAMHKAYEGRSFGGHTLEMVSISLDKDTLLWKKRIAQQNLDWKNHITDMGGWDSKQLKFFSVHSIPANYLVDHTGKIIASDVEGEELEKLLEKYYAD